MPAAHNSGPTVSGRRGPSRWASRPDWADSSSISTVVGSSAVPASSADHPTTTCNWSTERKKKPLKAA
ncbi:hypothetical protein GCM10020000_42370 [Streptomyces olivoverticillatus]